MARPLASLLLVILVATASVGCSAGATSQPTSSPAPAEPTAARYVKVLTELADALDEVIAMDGSDASVERALGLIEEASSYAPYFQSLSAEEAEQIADEYGEEVQAVAVRISTYATLAIQASGDDRILNALQEVPSFGIATRTHAP